MTVGMTLLFLVPKGIEVESKNTAQQIHNVLGLIVVIWAFIFIFSGFAARIAQENYEIKSLWVSRIKTFHRVLGYITLLIVKI